MTLIVCLFLSILPGIILGKYIYKKSVNKMPARVLIALLIFGAIITIPTALIEEVYGNIFTQENYWSNFLYFLIGVGFTEEIAKFIPAYLLGKKNNNFENKYDTIVYMTFSALGFAIFENFFYVFKGGLIVGILRMIFSVPGHVSWGILMGYFFSIAYTAKMNNDIKKYIINFLKCIFIPAIYHGLCDFVIVYGVDKMNILALILICILDIIVIVYIFKKLNRIAVENDNKYSKIISGFKLLFFELALIIMFTFLLNIDLYSYVEKMFNVNYPNESIMIAQDNLSLNVSSYEKIQFNGVYYLKIDLEIENFSNNVVSLTSLNFQLQRINQFNKQIANINPTNIYDESINIVPNENTLCSLYFQLESDEEENYVNILIYNSTDLDKEYNILLDATLEELFNGKVELKNE